MPKTRDGRLTQKQESFCLHYFECGNATKAAVLAKYSVHTAQFIAAENLSKPLIQARLDQLRAKAESAAVATVTERYKRLTNVVRGALLNPEEITPQHMLAAVDLLNKMDKIYTSEQSPPGTVVQTLVFIMPDGTRVHPGQLRELPNATE